VLGRAGGGGCVGVGGGALALATRGGVLFSAASPNQVIKINAYAYYHDQSATSMLHCCFFLIPYIP
jgi:hypothetical protein